MWVYRPALACSTRMSSPGPRVQIRAKAASRCCTRASAQGLEDPPQRVTSGQGESHVSAQFRQTCPLRLPLLGALLVVDVDAAAHQSDRHAGLIADGHPPGEHPAVVPVPVADAILDLSSTLSLFSGSAEVSLLGAMEGRNDPSHRTQGGSHGQYNRPTSQAVDLDATAPTRSAPLTVTAPDRRARAGAGSDGSPGNNAARWPGRPASAAASSSGSAASSPSRSTPSSTRWRQALTRPTYRRLVLLALAAILTIGGRTIANLLRTLGALAPGHSSSYHRALSHRRWSTRRLARRYIAAVLARFAPRGPVELAGDDTVTEHPGDTVYGKGCHRDPVRSTHSFTAYRWGHKWVVLAMLVRFPFARRRWALPLMVALYRPEEEGVDGVSRRAHKTPADLLGQMLRILIRWFPERTVRLLRRRQLRGARIGRAGRGASRAADVRQQVLPRGQPVRAAAAGRRQAAAASAPQEGEGVAQAGPSGPRHPESAGAERRLVRRGAPACRGGQRRRLVVSRAVGRWSRCGGSSSATGPGRTATSTSSRPM